MVPVTRVLAGSFAEAETFMHEALELGRRAHPMVESYFRLQLYALRREQRRLVVFGLACAFVYSGLSLAIPIVVRHAIDSSIAPKPGSHHATR